VKHIIFNKITIGVFLVFMIGSAVYIWMRRQSSIAISPLGESAIVQEPTSMPDVVLEDEWGLRVFYPADLTVRPATASGELTRYEFTHPVHRGKLSISTAESDAETIEEYLKLEKESATAGANLLDTTLDGRDAKKLRLANRTRVVSIDTGQVFLFEVAPDEGSEEYWNTVFESIIEQFQFLPFEGEEEIAPPVADPGGSVIEYEEEVIE
jgi:hypothetical protein